MSRGSADAAVGMMDAAYFTGRKELLDFFNDLLDLNLSKIEQTATGAIACQVADLIFPGSIPMSRVNWSARSDYEFVQNYKLLQIAFTKHRVQRHVDVDKLIRAKYQDNLEFCQWLKAFFDQSGGSSSSHRDDYDPCAVRARGKGGVKYNEEMAKGGGASRPRPRAVAAPKLTAKTTNHSSSNAAAAAAATNLAASERFSRPLRERVTNPVVAALAPNKDDPMGAAVAADAALVLKNSELLAKVEDLELAVLETEKERNFYFEKLRNVEIILQVHQERGEASNLNHIVDSAFKILYATAEDKLTVNEDGEVVAEDDVIDSLADSV